MMTVYEYLTQATYLDERIRMEKQECQRLREATRGLRSPSLEQRIDGTKETGAAYTHALNSLMDQEKLLEANVAKMVELKAQILQVINQVKSPYGRMALQLRYLNGETWPAIADKMHYSRVSVIHWANAAMSEITLPEDAIDLNKP